MNTKTSPRIQYLKNSQERVSHPGGLPPQWRLRMIRLGFQVPGRLLPRQAARKALQLFITPRRSKKAPKLTPIMKSAQAFQLPHRDGYVQAYAWGQGPERVLLVHGWNSKASHWSAFIPPLVEAGYQVIALDNPAHGHSAGTTSDLYDTREAIRAVIECVGPVAHIVAHSFGGAASSFLLWDEKATLSVDKLVLMGAPVRLQWVIDDYARMIRLPRTAKKWLETYLERSVNHKIGDLDLSRSGNALRAKGILVVHDERDESIPIAESLRLLSLDRPVSFLVLEGFGHFGMIKSPEVAGAVIRFLKEG